MQKVFIASNLGITKLCLSLQILKANIIIHENKSFFQALLVLGKKYKLVGPRVVAQWPNSRLIIPSSRVQV
jgi:hypothetical protein